jgi:hypothetical protein
MVSDAIFEGLPPEEQRLSHSRTRWRPGCGRAGGDAAVGDGEHGQDVRQVLVHVAGVQGGQLRGGAEGGTDRWTRSSRSGSIPALTTGRWFRGGRRPRGDEAPRAVSVDRGLDPPLFCSPFLRSFLRAEACCLSPWLWGHGLSLWLSSLAELEGIKGGAHVMQVCAL